MATLATPSPFQLQIPSRYWESIPKHGQLAIAFWSSDEDRSNPRWKSFGFSLAAKFKFDMIITLLEESRVPHAVAFLGGN